MKKLLAAILALTAVSLSCCGAESPRPYIKVMLKSDGTVLAEGSDIDAKEVADSLKKEIGKAPQEKVNGFPVSTLEILTETTGPVRYEQVMKVLDACSRLGVWRLYYSHPDVNGGVAVKVELPVSLSAPEDYVKKPLLLEPVDDKELAVARDTKPPETAEPPKAATVTVSEPGKAKKRARPRERVFVRMLWIDPSAPEPTDPAKKDPYGSGGAFVVYVNGPAVPTGGKPYWEQFETMLRNAVRGAGFEVDLRPSSKVRFRDVLQCALTCINSGAGSIKLGPADQYQK